MASSEVYLNVVGNKLLMSFEFSPKTKAKVKTISGSRWNPNYARWEAPLASYDQIINSIESVTVSDGVRDRLQRDAALIKQVQELKDLDYFEIPDYVPKLGLYPHQKKAFELHRILPGSGNFSEVGAGKTASTICAMHYQILMKRVERCLVVCPLSIIEGWQEQLVMFSDMTYIALVGTKQQRLKKLQEDRDVYLINYDYLRYIKDELVGRGFDFVVMDECHRIKNTQAKQSKAAYEIGDSARYRVGLTGSPILNTPLDAFGIMRFIDPSVFGESFYSFRSKYFKNLSQNSTIPMFVPRSGTEQMVSDKLYSRAVRVLKDECMDLPEAVTLPNRVVTLSPEQDKAYKQMQEDLMVELGELAEKRTIKISHVLTVLMKLNQITSGWIKVPNSTEIIHFPKNPKLRELITIMEDEVCGKPVILWAYYKADMDLLFNQFALCKKCRKNVNDMLGGTCVCGAPIKHRVSQVRGGIKLREFQIARFRLTTKERAKLRVKLVEEGATKREIREKLGDLIDGQEAEQTDVFIGQISAASEGLNLQRATTSIYYSRDYSLKNHIQSLGRNHRGGQKNTVVYYNIVCCRQNGEDTVDMRILAALTRKESLSQRINKDDIKFLLPNFKKRDREAIKDVDLAAENEEECKIPDESGQPAIESGDTASNVGTSEPDSEPEPKATQPGLF